MYKATQQHHNYDEYKTRGLALQVVATIIRSISVCVACVQICVYAKDVLVSLPLQHRETLPSYLI